MSSGVGAPDGVQELTVALCLSGVFHHLFFDQTQHTWTPADRLTPSTRLRTPTGKTLRITQTSRQVGHPAVHDLTIARLHTYYVEAGATPVLVHNSGGCDSTGRALWQLTKDGSTAMKRGGPFNTTFYKSASDGTWRTPDMVGHGSSAFKVFEETKKGLQWIRDADKHGTYIDGKWKGDTGRFIPWSNLRGAG